MIKNEELLPLGSIVYLEEGTVKLMIVGRGGHIWWSRRYWSIVCWLYGDFISGWPSTESTLFFQHENIDEVIFEGYRDEEEERFLKIYHEWGKKVSIPKSR